MTYVDLPGANLHGANFNGAKLSRVDFHGANLDEANLSKTQTYELLFHQATLRRANLRQADLSYAHLSHADLRQAACDGAHGFVEFDWQDPPLWPGIPVAERSVLQAEAADPATSDGRLHAIVHSWPGYLVREAVMDNPKLPTDLALIIGLSHPTAFLRHPSIRLLFATQPTWLTPRQAAMLLQKWEKSPELLHCEEAFPEQLRLIRQQASLA
jgi:hypothetical protein